MVMRRGEERPVLAGEAEELGMEVEPRRLPEQKRRSCSQSPARSDLLLGALFNIMQPDSSAPAAAPAPDGQGESLLNNAIPDIIVYLSAITNALSSAGISISGTFPATAVSSSGSDSATFFCSCCRCSCVIQPARQHITEYICARFYFFSRLPLIHRRGGFQKLCRYLGVALELWCLAERLIPEKGYSEHCAPQAFPGLGSCVALGVFLCQQAHFGGD